MASFTSRKKSFRQREKKVAKIKSLLLEKFHFLKILLFLHPEGFMESRVGYRKIFFRNVCLVINYFYGKVSCASISNNCKTSAENLFYRNEDLQIAALLKTDSVCLCSVRWLHSCALNVLLGPKFNTLYHYRGSSRDFCHKYMPYDKLSYYPSSPLVLWFKPLKNM